MSGKELCRPRGQSVEIILPIIGGIQPWTAHSAHVIFTILSCDHIPSYSTCFSISQRDKMGHDLFHQPRCHSSNLRLRRYAGRNDFLRFLHYANINSLHLQEPRVNWIPSFGASVCRGTRLVTFDI